MGSLLLPTAVAIAVGVGCRCGSEKHEPPPSVEAPKVTGSADSRDDSEVKPFKLANPVSDRDLMDALASSDGGAWREAVVRLAHKMPAPASALESMVGHSKELDQRIEKLLSLALFLTTSMDQLEKHSRLRNPAARRVEEAREFLVDNPPSRPDTHPEPMFGPEHSLPPKESAAKFRGFVVPVHVTTALRSTSAQTKAAALLSLWKPTAARPAVTILLTDNTKVTENYGGYYVTSSIGACAARVGKNRWEETTTLEVKDYVQTLEELDAPYDRLNRLINALRNQGTWDVNGWNEWWERARPLWNEWWRLNGAAESAVAIRQAIDALAARAPTWDDAARLVDPGQRSRVSKFQPCLPPDIEHRLIAGETMNVEDANATPAQWTRAPNQETEA